MAKRNGYLGILREEFRGEPHNRGFGRCYLQVLEER